eukprot:jgi/Mesen1/4815/ME000243S03994
MAHLLSRVCALSAVVTFLLLVQSPSADAAIRYYEFNVSYATIAPDCVEKTVPVVNGQYPGPDIVGVSGDRFIIQACNLLPDQKIALHWHGMFQKDTPWADGPAYGTQCPIRFGDCFVYNFTTNQVGTFWWHGHSGLLRHSVYGSMVIHPPAGADVPFIAPFGEKTLLFNDWYHRNADDIIEGLHSRSWQFIGEPDALLINGRGQVKCSEYVCPTEVSVPKKCNTCNQNSPFCNPLTTVIVKPGKTYRIRIVNVALWAQQNIQIEGHKLTVVEIDGNYVKPVVVDSLQTFPGQAFSVLVTFNQTPGDYWIASNGQYDNLGANPGRAVLHYYGACGPAGCKNPVPPRPIPTGPDYTKVSFGPYQQLEFKNYKTVPGLATQKIDRYIKLQWNMNLNDGYIRYSVNNISYIRTETPLLASEYYGFPNVFTKNNEIPSYPPPLNATDFSLKPAKLAAGVLTVIKDEWIQIVLQNHIPPGGHHPWHLHGFDFYVVGYGAGEYNYRQEEELSKNYNLIDPHVRNVVTVWENHWIAIRFKADNAGLWNMHCKFLGPPFFH